MFSKIISSLIIGVIAASANFLFSDVIASSSELNRTAFFTKALNDLDVVEQKKIPIKNIVNEKESLINYFINYSSLLIFIFFVVFHG